MTKIVRYFDGRQRMEFDRDDFELVCLLLAEKPNVSGNGIKVVTQLVDELGYSRADAMHMVVVAGREPIKDGE